MKRWAALCRFGGIGDNLIAVSPARALKRQGYMVEVITNDTNHQVFLNNPNIDKLSIKNVDSDVPKDGLQWQQFWGSRAREYDVFCHLSHSCESRHAVFQGMTEWWWPDEYRRKRCAGSYLETAHDIAGVPYDFGPLYYATDEEIERALETKKRIMGEARCITWVLSGTRPDKVYPYTAFAVCRLIQETDAHVVLMGASALEFQMAETIQKTLQINIGSVDKLHLALSPTNSEAGGEFNWPIRRSLAYAIHASDVLVAPDTGPAWACSMYDMPKVILISHTSAENVTKHWVNTTTLTADANKVPCWPCHKLHDTLDTCVPNPENNGAACISNIPVETIVGLVKQKLEHPKGNVVAFRTA